MRSLAVWVGWTAAMLALWLALTQKLRMPEVLIGLGAAALASGALAAVRHGARPVAAPRPRWLVPALRLPWAVLRESALLLAVLARALLGRRRVTGRLRPIAFEGGGRRGARSIARRALATWLGSLAPNAYVLGFDVEHDVVLVHELVATKEPPTGIRELASR